VYNPSYQIFAQSKELRKEVEDRLKTNDEKSFSLTLEVPSEPDDPYIIKAAAD